MTFNDKIDLLMETNNIKNLRQLASEIDIPYTTLWDYYSNPKRLEKAGITNIRKIAERLGCSMDYLTCDYITDFNNTTSLDVDKADIKISVNSHRMFGDIFRELRREKKLSQDKIAIEFKVSQGLIAKWEKHQSTPAPEMLDYIADYFNVSTDYLLGRTTNRLFNKEELPLIEQYKILINKDNSLSDIQKKFLIDFLETQHKNK